MPIEFPITPEMIREEMKRIISDIREETNWELKRDLSEVKIEIGDAPEYGPTFGVVRSIDKLVFGSWMEDLRPKYYRTNLVEFLIIRDSIAHFIDNELFFESGIDLVQYVLNLCALSYMRRIYDNREFEIKLVNIRNRFLFESEKLTDEERYYHSLIQSLSSIIISQKISHILIFETFLHFIGEPPYDDVEEIEILHFMYRYLSNIPEEIVAPIKLKPKTLQVLEQVIELGFDASANTIAKKMGKDISTITREFLKITNRYNAYLRVQKNFYKLGLHFYFIIIRLAKDNEDNLQRSIDELSKIKYIGEIYEGTNNVFNYIYSTILCPHFVVDSLGNKLDKMKKNKIIDLFEIKPLKNRLYMTSFVEERFEPSIENYQLLLNKKLQCTKIKTWDDNRFQQDTPIKFTEKEENLLRAISVYKSNSLVNPQLYRVFTTQLKKFATDNNIDINKLDDFLGFMNNQRNQLLEKGLIDFRLELTITDLAINDVLVIKVNCDPDTNEIVKLIDRLSIFSWIAFLISHDSLIIQILGLNNDHAISKLVTDIIENLGFEFELFTANNKVWRFIPLAELYHFQGNKWSLL